MKKISTNENVCLNKVILKGLLTITILATNAQSVLAGPAGKETYRPITETMDKKALEAKQNIEAAIGISRNKAVEDIMRKNGVGTGKVMNVREPGALVTALRKAPVDVVVDEGKVNVDYAVKVAMVQAIAAEAISNKTGPDSAKSEAIIKFAQVYAEFVSLGVNLGTNKADIDAFNLQIAAGDAVKTLSLEDIQQHTSIMEKTIEKKQRSNDIGPELFKRTLAEENLDQKEILKRLICCEKKKKKA